MSNTIGRVEGDGHEKYNVDELVQCHKSETESRDEELVTRDINLILDHTAFVRGIGNIKRWKNEDYLSTVKFKKNVVVKLNLYVPSYTLHEFEYLRRGFLMSAVNARESIKLLDNFFEGEGGPVKKGDHILFDIFLESMSDRLISWEACLNYQVYKPVTSDFPQVTAELEPRLEPANHYSNSNSQESTMKDSREAYVTIPKRLTYLIRSCVYKSFREGSQTKSKWFLVTEDASTKVWAKSFGISCLNVNEADLLIFKDYDANQFASYNPNTSFVLDDDENFISDTILQHTIDTSKYKYKSVHDVSKKNKQRQRNDKGSDRIHGNKERKSTKNNETTNKNTRNGKLSNTSNKSSDYVNEDFDAINYAPRGKGILWEP